MRRHICLRHLEIKEGERQCPLLLRFEKGTPLSAGVCQLCRAEAHCEHGWTNATLGFACKLKLLPVHDSLDKWQRIILLLQLRCTTNRFQKISHWHQLWSLGICSAYSPFVSALEEFVDKTEQVCFESHEPKSFLHQAACFSSEEHQQTTFVIYSLFTLLLWLGHSDIFFVQEKHDRDSLESQASITL